jgi:hypothetical protein
MFRKHFNATTMVAMVALVFAMTGGAFAVSSKGGASHATAAAARQKNKPKLLRGPRGPEGKQGPAGPAGLSGPASAEGKPGPEGKTGPEGKAGVAGAGVAASEVKVGEGVCNKLGGSRFTVGGKETYACNGAEGEPGPAGLPCTASGTLPAGKTETGYWALNDYGKSKEEGVYTAVSFPCPLAAGMPNTAIHFICPSNSPSGCATSNAACPGTVASPVNPAPASGTLCIFLSLSQDIKEYAGPLDVKVEEGADPSGTLLRFKTEGAEQQAIAFGTWAVTG